jgi:hypothetical protein
MRKPAVVLGPTGVQMVDQMLARVGIKALQIFVRKGPQARMAGQVRLGFAGDVRRAVVQDQVQAWGPGIVAGEPPQRPQEMRMVIGFQTTSPHRAIIDVHSRQERDRPISLVLELPPRELPATQRLGRTTPHQHLHRGLFIQTEDHFVALIEPLNPFIPPQHLGRLGDEPLVHGRRLPIAPAMGLQTGLGQDPRHRGVMHGPHNRLFHHHLLQTAAVPAGQVPALGGRVSAGDALEVHARPRGKKRTGARSVQHHRRRQLPTAGTVATEARGLGDSTPASGQSRGCARPDPVPRGPGHGSPPAGSGGHQRAWPVTRVDRPRVSDTAMVCVPSSDSLLVLPGKDEPDEVGMSICFKIFATVH